MKVIATAPDGSKHNLTLLLPNNRPRVQFEEIEIAHTGESGIGYIAGNHTWDYIETAENLDVFIALGSVFSAVSEPEHTYLNGTYEWSFPLCWVRPDRKSIYIKECNCRTL